MPTITREQLQSIEWAGQEGQDFEPYCPACDTSRRRGHAADCWLAAALATPDTLPPVAVGDVVLQENGGVEYVTDSGCDYWTGADVMGLSEVIERRKARIAAIYRTPLWQRGKE